MAKTKDEMARELAELSYKAGMIQYQIFTLTKDLELLNQSIRDLNLEAFNARKEEEKK